MGQRAGLKIRVFAGCLIVFAPLWAPIPNSDASASPASSAQTFESIQVLLRHLNDGGTSLDPSFTVAAPLSGSLDSIQVWTSTGTATDALSQAVTSAGLSIAIRKSAVSRATINAIESRAIADAQSHANFGGAEIVGVTVDFIHPVQVIVSQDSAAVESAVLDEFAVLGQGVVTVVQGGSLGHTLVDKTMPRRTTAARSSKPLVPRQSSVRADSVRTVSLTEAGIFSPRSTASITPISGSGMAAMTTWG